MKYLFIPIFSLFILLCDSCEVVNLHPISTLTEVNFYNTSEDLDKAVLGIYSRLQSRLPRDWTIMEMPTDHLYISSYRFIGGLEAVDNLDFHPQNDIFKNFWQSTYNGIYRANALLRNLNNPENMEQELQDQFEGEAKFMRALFYFDLVRAFGGVPKVIAPLSIDDSKTLGRASESDIYELIVEDLNRAITVLPLQANIERGRAAKEAAIALLGKVFVYNQDWNNALKEFDKFEFFDYDLIDKYGDLWKEEKEDNEEVVFAIKYVSSENGHGLSRDFLPYFGVEGYSNSSGGEVALPAWSLMKKFKDEDTRKEATFTELWKAPGSDGSLEWRPFVSKFIAQNAGSSGLDIPVIRFSDVLLLKSEALYYSGEIEMALDNINKVRERAFGDESYNYVLSDIDSEDKFIDIILLERQLEFAFENERWFDLVRLDRFVEKLKEQERSFNPSTGKPEIATFDPKEFYRYFPIPQHEIDQSERGVISQNEGY